MLGRALVLLSFLLTLSVAAQAAPVTLQSQWQYQLHPSSLNVSGLGLFTFTYDDTTPINSISGTAPFQNAVYLNAITSATFELGSLILHLDDTSNNSVYILEKNHSGGVDATITTHMLDSGGTGYKVFLGFEMRRDLTTLSLANLDGLNNEDSPWAYVQPDSCNNPFVCGYSLEQQGVQSAVPIPAAAWLFGSGLLGLVGFKRRGIFSPRR